METEQHRLSRRDLEANTEFRHSALSWEESEIMPFEAMDGMKRKHSPDLTRCQHESEEGDRLESSTLRFARWYFLACLRIDTHTHTLVVSLMESTGLS